MAGGTHIWRRRGSRIWREASVLKYKAAPKVRRAPYPPQGPHLWEILVLPRHHPLLAPRLGTHHWLQRDAETASVPSPRPGGSLGEEARLKAAFRTLPLNPPPGLSHLQSLVCPVPSCPQDLLKREVTTAPAPEATICCRRLMPPGSWSAISWLQY